MELKGNAMGFYGRSNRALVDQALRSGALVDSQIVECDLSGIVASMTILDHVDIKDLNANNAVFANAQITTASFFRSNFMGAAFAGCTISGSSFDGLTLIKSKWDNCGIINSSIKNSCMQRAQYRNSRIISSTLSDFEALNVQIKNTLFAHSLIGINYGSGMNGFSEAVIDNCIFFHCRFEGYPLRGALVKSSVFIHCTGEIGEDMDCTNVAGIGLRGNARLEHLQKPEEAQRLIERIAS